MNPRQQIINDSVITDNFSSSYPYINKYVIENGGKENSRNGNTTEIIDFKTTITDPYKRCVGNNGRDINIFFLLAEAIWIFKGEKDVKFLEIFNSKMKDFSDDGESFHAPYGFRLRHHGVSSFDKKKPLNEQQNHSVAQENEGVDQILLALLELKENPESRRVVMQIWNADLDLNVKSKDLPCNDLVFLKVRQGKLRTTISNRSNDLHWGLPTNVFQFSFLTELMSNILNIELGTQTHNSNSLHIYEDSTIAWKMYENHQLNLNDFVDLYQRFSPMRIDTNFKSDNVVFRLNELDYHLGNIIESLKTGRNMDFEDLELLLNFSKYLYYVYQLLAVYITYKGSLKGDNEKVEAINEIKTINFKYGTIDITGLALNFFVSKINDTKKLPSDLETYLGKL